MREYGSDFHRCDSDFYGLSNYFNGLGCARFYACGRHAIDAIVAQEGWKRVWIPAYFCYEVVKHISASGIAVQFYYDYPLCNDDDALVRSLPYIEGDVLLRVNFFGLRGWRSNQDIPVPVIEDHTHALISGWALNSNADWCIASIRKSLPVAAGGILWSPIGKKLPKQIEASSACEEMAKIRYTAMKMKADYLRIGGDKNVFRNKYIDSEEMIEHLVLSGMDKESTRIIHAMDIKLWTELRSDNWHLAYSMLNKNFVILKSVEEDCWQPFSLIILCNSAEERIALRQYLIENCIYPAILWQVPENTAFPAVLDFSQRMLVVHCDIRYDRNEIEKMCRIINSYYD